MTTPEPKDKLGTTTTNTGGDTFAVAVNVVVVNGPEGDVREWDAISWRAIEQEVRSLNNTRLQACLSRMR
jgi:hypothetical protein